jgi:hypothetical protein
MNACVRGWRSSCNAVGMAYLCATVLARRAHNIVGTGGHDVAHAVFADLVFLFVVFYLWWGQPRQLSMRAVAGYTSV